MEQNTQSSENNNQAENNVGSGQIFNEPRKKSSKKIVLLVGVIMIILGAVALYFLFFSNKEDNNIPAVENEKNEEVEIDKELDSDQDGLPDYIEKILRTDLGKADTDNDTYSDFNEIKNGYNPLNNKKYTEEEWNGVKARINDERLYKEIFGMKREQSIFICGATTVKDIDGNIYNTVEISSQCWLKENLKVTRNPEGRVIDSDCYDNNTKICDTDGRLYTWLTSMDIIVNSIATNEGSIKVKEGAQGICPNGWHIPSDSEWHILENYLEDNEAETASGSFISCSGNDGYWIDCGTAGAKLRRGGSSGFDAVMTGFAEKSSFSSASQPDGFWHNGHFYKPNYRGANGFSQRGSNAYFWSSTSAPPYNPPGYNITLYGAWFRKLSLKYDGTLKDNYTKKGGMSVRCLKD